MPVLITDHVKKEDKISFQMTVESNPGLSHDVTAAMLAYRTIAKKAFWEFYYYAKRERGFVIVLYTNMAVLSRE